MIEFDRGALVHRDLHADTDVMLGRKQMIDHVETLFPPRPINRGHVDDIPEQAAGIVAQKAHHRNDVARLCLYRQFMMRNRIALDRSGQRVSDCTAESFEDFIHRQRSIVAVRRIFFCRRSTP